MDLIKRIPPLKNLHDLRREKLRHILRLEKITRMEKVRAKFFAVRATAAKETLAHNLLASFYAR